MPDLEISKSEKREKWWVCYVRPFPYNGPPYRNRSVDMDAAQGVRVIEGRGDEDRWNLIAVKIPNAPARGRARAERIARRVIDEMEDP
jgi:hypothetical protein